MGTDSLLALTTCKGPEDAERISTALVERRLAACVNAIGGVVSTYRWDGDVAREPETLLLIKTTAERYQALEQTIRELSTYELPEIVAVRIAAGSADYLAWLAGAVEKDSK